MSAKPLLLTVVTVSMVLGCSRTVELDVRVAPTCRGRTFLNDIQTVKVAVTDPSGENVPLLDEGQSTSGTYSQGSISVPAVPTVDDPTGAASSTMLVTWQASKASTPDFAASDIIGFGASVALSIDPELPGWSGGGLFSSAVRTVYVPMIQVGRFTEATELHRTYDAQDPGNFCAQLGVDRYGHTATYIPSIGRVLIVGGRTTCSTGTTCVFPDGEERGVTDAVSAELFDPSTGVFEAIANPPGGGRAFHSATLIGTGTVLVAGGRYFNDDLGSEDVSGKAVLFSGAKYLESLTDDSVNPWGSMITMGDGGQLARAHHGAIAVPGENRVVLAGGVARTANGSAFPDLGLEVVGIGTALPTVVTFDLDSDGSGGVWSEALDHLDRPRAGAQLAIQEHSSGPRVVVIGGYDSAGAVAAIEVISNLTGVSGSIEVAPFPVALPVGVFAHTATTVGQKVLVYGGFKSFPSLNDDPSISCTANQTTCFLEYLRLRVPDVGEAFRSLDESIAEEVQLIDLQSETANTINAARADEGDSLYAANQILGRVWHQAVAIDDHTVLVAGGLARAQGGNGQTEVAHRPGRQVELCEIGQNPRCRTPKDFQIKGAEGRAEFQLNALPGGTLFLSGGRVGPSGVQPDSSTLAPTANAQIGIPPIVR
jgi:hypothetical protein